MEYGLRSIDTNGLHLYVFFISLLYQNFKKWTQTLDTMHLDKLHFLQMRFEVGVYLAFEVLRGKL